MRRQSPGSHRSLRSMADNRSPKNPGKDGAARTQRRERERVGCTTLYCRAATRATHQKGVGGWLYRRAAGGSVRQTYLGGGHRRFGSIGNDPQNVTRASVAKLRVHGHAPSHTTWRRGAVARGSGQPRAPPRSLTRGHRCGAGQQERGGDGPRGCHCNVAPP